MQKLSITLNDVETELKENREKVKILTENNEDSFFNRYVIRLASEEEVQDYLSSLNKKEKAKVLSLNPTKKDD